MWPGDRQQQATAFGQVFESREVEPINRAHERAEFLTQSRKGAKKKAFVAFFPRYKAPAL